MRERRTIEDMLNAKISIDSIAAEIGRHRSTVFREIKRNRFVDDELPVMSQSFQGLINPAFLPDLSC